MADEAPDVRTLERFLDAFNRHDVEGVMEFFTEDCVFETPRGSDPWGRRLEGKDEVRGGVEARFAGIPDIHYGKDRIGCWATEASRSGRSAERTRPPSQWKSRDAICSSSATGRSPARTHIGRS